MYDSTSTGDQTDSAAPPLEEVYENHRITRNKDGTVSIVGPTTKGLGPRIPQQGEFDENLADQLINGQHLGSKLVEFYNEDMESRSDWEERERRALKMMGITEETMKVAKENDTAPGLNRMVHPMLIEGVVRFQANAITEIFPPEGPAKTKILGKSTHEKEQQAERIETFTNYYLTEVDREYFADTDQMLLYLPMSGSVFRKGGQNWVTGLPELRYVKATNFIAPYAGTDLRSMSRYAHEYTMSGDDIRRAIESGMFMQITLPKSGNDAKHAMASDIADSREPVMHVDDELYPILEYHVDLDLSDIDDKAGDTPEQPVRPYIVVVEKQNQKVLMVRRNWREGDDKYQKRIWFAHHKYLPGLGFYGFGLTHLIGSLGNAASAAVNAILDAAQMATFQGGFRTKEGKQMAGEVRLEPGVWKDVDATYEELAKSFYTPPYKEPGPALASLLENLVGSGQRFMGSTDAATGDASNMGPVGTTIALIEQSQKPQSAIHKRLHKSMSDELKMFGELVHDFMPDTYEYQIGGDGQELRKQDFDGRVDVISVTDPNIHSSAQRIQMAQATNEIVTQNPDLFTPKKKAIAVRRMMEALRLPDIEEIAPQAETPKYLDPVSENGLIVRGKGVRAYETQDHAAHIKIHQQGAATAATQQMDPDVQQAILSGFGVHIRDHMALLYRAQIMAAAGIPPPPLDEDGEPVELDPATEAMITAAVVAKLPPPPPPPAPPPQAPSPAEVSQQKLKAMQDESQAKIERDTQDFTRAEARKEEEHKAGLRRADEAARAESARKDRAAAAELIRGGAKAGSAGRVDHHRALVGHKHKIVESNLKLHAQAKAAEAKIAEMRRVGAEKAAAARAAAQQKLQTDKAMAEQKVAAAKAAAKAKPKPKPAAKAKK